MRACVLFSVLALFGGVLADVGAVVELPVEQLHAHHGEDELREVGKQLFCLIKYLGNWCSFTAEDFSAGLT